MAREMSSGRVQVKAIGKPMHRQINPLSIKANTRIGTWNIRTLYKVRKATQVAKDIYDI